MNHQQLFERTKQSLLREGWSEAAAVQQAEAFVRIHDIVFIDAETGEEHVYLGSEHELDGRNGGDEYGNGVSEVLPRQKDE